MIPHLQISYSGIWKNGPKVRTALSTAWKDSNLVYSSLVVETLTDTYAPVPTIYFYCYFGEKERQGASAVTRSLLKQLSAQSERLDPEILLAFNNDSSLTTDSAEILLASAFRRFRKVFVVVDALDECSEPERKSMIQLFDRQVQLAGCCVKVFLTSRAESDIGRLLEGRLSHYIDADDTSKDITPYVAATVEDCIADGSLLSGVVSPNLKRHLIETLNGEADGMYVLPSVTLTIKSCLNQSRCI